MGTNSLMAIGKPGRFGGTSTHLSRRAPASPMVLQHFMQILGNLSNKVDALAVSQEKALSARHAPAITTMARPVESREVQIDPVQSSPPKEHRRTRVKRSLLLDIFD